MAPCTSENLCLLLHTGTSLRLQSLTLLLISLYTGTKLRLSTVLKGFFGTFLVKYVPSVTKADSQNQRNLLSLQMTWYVVGHRAWLGHKKRVTIPLWRLPGLEDENWETYQSELRRWDFYGAPRNRTAEPFAVPIYGNPVPNCMCQPEGGPLPFNSRTCKTDAYKCVDER